MEKIKLTEQEIGILKEEISNSDKYRSKQLKRLGILLISSLILLFVFLSIQSNSEILSKLTTISIFGILMVIPSLFSWFMAGIPIKKLKRDLANGTKLVGHSKVKSRNILNHNIKLTDGTPISVLDDSTRTWKVGDLISYKITPSKEYLLEYKNATLTRPRL
jgi:hypothetical protein